MRKLILIDRSEPQCRAWADAFVHDEHPVAEPEIVIVHGDITEEIRRHEPDGFMTAGNSFGVMDGGIDLVVRRLLPQVQSRVLDAIFERGNFLPVGSAVTVATGEEHCPYLVYVPTMHVPEQVHGYNAFLAFHAALIDADRFGIQTLMACGLATATGGFSPEACARQMRTALDFVLMPPLPGEDDDGIRYGQHLWDQTRWQHASERYAKLKEVKW